MPARLAPELWPGISRNTQTGGWFETLSRKTLHRMVRRVTGLDLKQLGCGARTLRRTVLKDISLHSEQYDLFTVLGNRQGFRIAAVDMTQSPRDYFEGCYQPEEDTHRPLDIFSVFLLARLTKNPLPFFGMIGASIFAISVLASPWLVIERLLLEVTLAHRQALLV